MTGKVFSLVKVSNAVALRNAVVLNAVGLLLAVDETGRLNMYDNHNGNVVAVVAHGRLLDELHPLREVGGRYAVALSRAADGVVTIRFSDGLEAVTLNGKYHGWAFVRDGGGAVIGDAVWHFAEEKLETVDVRWTSTEEEEEEEEEARG